MKPAYEDGSVGIDSGCVLYDAKQRDRKLDTLKRAFKGQPIIVEEYIEGREFHVSLIERQDGAVEVLPIAETLFIDWPKDKPRIIGYLAKWDINSIEYKNTVRVFVRSLFIVL
ncbi:D-alanine--D-alanine ligase [Candidatus Magnetoovum chiemensis]|nr:D-alanine--D-alanine ligase [Candidatus Magnetoovum chiemensis]